ncbi:NUDIX hydrolase [Streptomyces sp. NPDC059788]|uniref:NUDIX hydrolase n=1 Tax=Streptomyces sp. NPDC059788 TaxID=3346948 RepID=UPI0036669096
MTAPAKPIRAAGCVLWRRSPTATATDAATDTDTYTYTATFSATNSGLEIALVHRPKYDDWSHPKGKLKRDEDWLAGALREVAEETGMQCRPGVELPASHYLAGGRPKEVRYWAAEATHGSFDPNLEVDRLLWLPPEQARRILTQERDRELVDALLEALRGAGRGSAR